MMHTSLLKDTYSFSSPFCFVTRQSISAEKEPKNFQPNCPLSLSSNSIALLEAWKIGKGEDVGLTVPHLPFAPSQKFLAHFTWIYTPTPLASSQDKALVERVKKKKFGPRASIVYSLVRGI